jgi:antitoxin VapB
MDSRKLSYYNVEIFLHAMNFMALNIRNRETEQLANALAKLTGETKTQAVTVALRDRLGKEQRKRSGRRMANELDEIALHCASLPVLDNRTPEEILGYDETGVPR